MIRYCVVIALVLFVYCVPSTVSAESPFGYELTTDVVYGKGKITKDGRVVERDLLMDVYVPTKPANGQKRPAVILVHGGAFHRGGLRLPPFREAGAVHSAMQDWARFLTPQGYVCFVIEYRLVTEHPLIDIDLNAQGVLSIDEIITDAGLARTNYARKAMGLPEVPNEERELLVRGLFAAAEDLNKAVLKVQKESRKYGVDPKRIAAGGHSAGGTTVLNAVYGLKSPVKAAFPLSPTVTGYDFGKVITSPDQTPVLVIMSQYDVDATLQSVPPFMEMTRKLGLESNLAWVPGFGHFYPTGAITLGDDGRRLSVGERVTEFLDRILKDK